MKNRVRAVTWLLIVYGLFTAALAASIEPVRINNVRKGALLLQTGDSSDYHLATSVSSDVRIDVTGPVARAIVIQRFTNPSSEWAQGLYAFPLPEQDDGRSHQEVRYRDSGLQSSRYQLSQVRPVRGLTCPGLPGLPGL
ncbi:MAG: hypothetical protein DSY87_02190 [Methylococcus sp.]|nr:MAG: hypothetical protein DSY87_02190 [Methylococcus sp.]